MSRERDPQATRVVVLLDDTRGARVALETAADLAARQHSELVGVLVEDTDLVRSAGLPFTREISLTSGRVHPLQSEGLEDRLRIRAHRLERALATTGRRHALAWRFQLSRQRLERAALATTHPRDTLVLGRNGWRQGASAGVGSVASRVARGTRCSVFIVGDRPPRPNRPVMVLQPAGDDPGATLDTAVRLARDRSQPLCILLPPGRGPGARLERAAHEWSARVGTPVQFQRIADASAATLIGALHRHDGQALVVSRRSAALQSDDGYRLLDDIDTPVLVVD